MSSCRATNAKIVDGMHINLLVERSTIERLDAWAAHLRAALPEGVVFTRADLIRDLLAKAVEARGDAGGRRRAKG